VAGLGEHADGALLDCLFDEAKAVRSLSSSCHEEIAWFDATGVVMEPGYARVIGISKGHSEALGDARE